MGGKIPVRGNTGNLEICQITGNFVCSSCRFPDSTDKNIVIFAVNFFSSSEAEYVCQVSFVYVIVTGNICGWTGNTYGI